MFSADRIAISMTENDHNDASNINNIDRQNNDANKK